MIYTNQKSKDKKKFRSAEQAKKARANQESWKKLLEKYDVKETKKSNFKISSKTPTDYRRTVFDDAKSLQTEHGVATKKQIPVYTGDAMIGISTLHKSNGVPVFRDEDIKDISKMRRG